MTLPPPKKPKSGWIPVSSDHLRKPGQAYRRPSPPPPSENAIKRAAQAHQLQAMGKPLAQQISLYAKARGEGHPPVLSHGLAMAGCSATMMLSFALGAPVVVPVLAGAGIFFFACRLALKMRKIGQTASLEAEIDLAAHFDQCLAASSAQLPENICDILEEIKNSLAQLLPNLPQIRRQLLLGHADIFYITQAAKQYVPDALQAFLAIPPDDQSKALGLDGKSAVMLLEEQLQLIAAKLAQLQQELLQQHGQKLLVQKRFLQEKS